MAAQKHDPKELTFREVYLSDLKPIKALYLGTTTDGNQGMSDDKLNEHFGIPLNLVEWNKKVIAYSFVNMSTDTTPQIQLKIDQEFESLNIADRLTNITLKSHEAIYGLNRSQSFARGKSVQNSIRSFVDWMNQCN